MEICTLNDNNIFNNAISEKITMDEIANIPEKTLYKLIRVGLSEDCRNYIDERFDTNVWNKNALMEIINANSKEEQISIAKNIVAKQLENMDELEIKIKETKRLLRLGKEHTDFENLLLYTGIKHKDAFEELYSWYKDDAYATYGHVVYYIANYWKCYIIDRYSASKIVDELIELKLLEIYYKENDDRKYIRFNPEQLKYIIFTAQTNKTPRSLPRIISRLIDITTDYPDYEITKYTIQDLANSSVTGDSIFKFLIINKILKVKCIDKGLKCCTMTLPWERDMIELIR